MNKSSKHFSKEIKILLNELVTKVSTNYESLLMETSIYDDSSSVTSSLSSSESEEEENLNEVKCFVCNTKQTLYWHRVAKGSDRIACNRCFQNRSYLLAFSNEEQSTATTSDEEISKKRNLDSESGDDQHQDSSSVKDSNFIDVPKKITRSNTKMNEDIQFTALDIISTTNKRIKTIIEPSTKIITESITKTEPSLNPKTTIKVEKETPTVTETKIKPLIVTRKSARFQQNSTNNDANNNNSNNEENNNNNGEEQNNKEQKKSLRLLKLNQQKEQEQKEKELINNSEEINSNSEETVTIIKPQTESAISMEQCNNSAKNRRTKVFKLQTPNPTKCQKLITKLHTTETVFHRGFLMQIGDIVALFDQNEKDKFYFAQIRAFLVDQFGEKSAAIHWLVPIDSASMQNAFKTYQDFDFRKFRMGPVEELPRPLNTMEFVCRLVANDFLNSITGIGSMGQYYENQKQFLDQLRETKAFQKYEQDLFHFKNHLEEEAKSNKRQLITKIENNKQINHEEIN